MKSTVVYSSSHRSKGLLNIYSMGVPGYLSQLSVQLLISAQVLILRVVSSSPMLGSMLSVEPTLKKKKIHDMISSFNCQKAREYVFLGISRLAHPIL